MSVTDLPGVAGILRISRFRPDAATRRSEPATHRTVYVRGPTYDGMEDNDIRGYLDGSFADGWNQPGQSHVRLGRPPWTGGIPKYGEHELLRFLQRWSDVRLPAGARVLGSRLSLTVQRGPEAPLRVLVYLVRKDWSPGEGGRDGNSTSPPNVGEVWWRGPAFEQEEWGLPGAGFAADGHPDADTSATPLAWCLYEPGIRRLSFESPALSRYIEDRCSQGAPLLFLFKLSDHQEDIPGGLLDIYSANFGDSVTVDRRPSLEIVWRSDQEDWSDERQIILEHGRTLDLKPVEGRAGDWFAASFTPTEGFEPPLIEVREGGGARRSSWRPMVAPFRARSHAVEFRITAARNVVALGSPFQAEISETWTPAAARANAPIPWYFLSPNGEEHRVHSMPDPRHTWSLQFEPREVGRWSYRWEYCFDANYPVTESGVFDVLGRDLQSVMARVDALAAEAETARSASASNRHDRLHHLRVEFSRLQRAAMALETPDTFRSESGEHRRRSLRRAREALWGKPVPESPPLTPHPRDWPSVNGPRRPARRGRGRRWSSRVRGFVQRLRSSTES